MNPTRKKSETCDLDLEYGLGLGFIVPKRRKGEIVPKEGDMKETL